MRLAVVLAALLVTACGARSSSGPAWPKMAEREADGGESLSPRQGALSIAVAAAADDDEDDDIKVVATPTAATPAAATPSTSTSSPTVTAPEESITIEDIVIEIDD